MSDYGDYVPGSGGWYDDDADGGPSTEWLLGEIERELDDHERAEPGQSWPLGEDGTLDPEQILDMWQRAWGPLPDALIATFLERPEAEELLDYPFPLVAAAIRGEQKLDRALDLVRAEYNALFPPDVDVWEEDDSCENLIASEAKAGISIDTGIDSLPNNSTGGPVRDSGRHTPSVASRTVRQDIADQALDLLRRLTSRADAQFHAGQLDAITALVQQRRRALVVQRTGWGKSAVYFIATHLLRAQGSGPTLLVSPLLALMRNQVDAAARLGLRAETVNSANRDRWDDVESAIERDEVDLLLISAQRLANPEFQRNVLPVVGRRSGLLVIDEAHCISDWGHDFNPDYRRIGRVLDRLSSQVPVLACTATANDRVVTDIEGQLGEDLVTLRGPLARDGLALHVIELPSQAERLAWLATTIPQLSGSGIVYCLTVTDTLRVAAWLRDHGIEAHAYNGTTDPEARVEYEQALLSNRVKALVATSALGMGFDKPDLGFVVHFQSPGSPVHYYQQVGRAGRQLSRSLGILLAGHEDDDIQEWFIKTAFPPRHQAEQVVGLLARDGATLSTRQIEDEVNVRHSRLEAMLKMLEVEGAVERHVGGWRRTLQPWTYDAERVERITALRRREQQIMREYRTTGACRMELLGRVLDDPDAAPCGLCDNCTGESLPAAPDPQLVTEAREYLRQADIVHKPKQRGPNGPIPAQHRLTSARSLSRWGDGGWGGLVRQGKQVDRRFADDLVDAAATLIARWLPDPRPCWVTCVPSLRHPGLVPDYAARLAIQLGLPFHEVIHKVAERPPQKEMENSSQQLRNVVDAFAVASPVPLRPVLLVDDIWDSGWTMTIIGELLAAAGVPAVHALTLATATGG